MPTPRLAAVSRSFASTVQIVEGEPTARDQVLWLSMMASGLVAGDKMPDPEGKDADLVGWQARLLAAPAYQVVNRVDGLARDAGVDRLVRLQPMLERLKRSKVRVGAETVPMYLGWCVAYVVEGRVVIEKRDPERGHETVGSLFPGSVLAAAHVADDLRQDRLPILADLTAMRAFKCRYSPILYLRCLSWLAGGTPLPRGVKRVRSQSEDKVRVSLPFRTMGPILGAPKIRMRTHWDKLVLAPVIEDLAKAGLSVHAHWARHAGYERSYESLDLTVTRRVEEARPPKRMPKLVLTPRAPDPALAEADLPF